MSRTFNRVPAVRIRQSPPSTPGLVPGVFILTNRLSPRVGVDGGEWGRTAPSPQSCGGSPATQVAGYAGAAYPLRGSNPENAAIDPRPRTGLRQKMDAQHSRHQSGV